MNKWGKRQWKLNQQDFLEGEGAREKHKKDGLQRARRRGEDNGLSLKPASVAAT